MHIYKVVLSIFLRIFKTLVEIWSLWREWHIKFSVNWRRHLTRKLWRYCSARSTWRPILLYLGFSEASKMVIIAFHDISKFISFTDSLIHSFIHSSLIFDSYLGWLLCGRHKIRQCTWPGVNKAIPQMILQAGPEFGAKNHNTWVSTFLGGGEGRFELCSFVAKKKALSHICRNVQKWKDFPCIRKFIIKWSSVLAYFSEQRIKSQEGLSAHSHTLGRSSQQKLQNAKRMDLSILWLKKRAWVRVLRS